MSDWYDEDDVEDVVDLESENIGCIGFWSEDKYGHSYQLINEGDEVNLCKIPDDIELPTSIVPISLLMFSKLKRHSDW